MTAGSRTAEEAALPEYLSCKISEIDPPVPPDMASFCLQILIWIAMAVQIAAKSAVLLIQEIILPYGDIIQAHTVSELLRYLLLEVSIDAFRI